MADRTSAAIFAEVFEFLAETPDDPRTKAFAEKMWTRTHEHDFNSYQMECDEALLKLGLAQRSKNEFGDEKIVYKDCDS